MKKLEELGISPTPWGAITLDGRLHSVESSLRFDGEILSRDTVCSLCRVKPSNARLIAAAPKLYEALLEALPWLADIGAEVVGNDAAEKIAEVVKKAEAALAKASGESEVGK